MKAYVCTIGEPLTDICAEQLEKFGFEVRLIEGNQPWSDKYANFISMADDDCIRIDADTIPNKEIKQLLRHIPSNADMIQFHGYDLYKNKVGITTPIFYSKRAIEFIRDHFNELDLRRPEASAWRLLEKEGFRVLTHLAVVAIHGLYLREEDIKRHKKHKIERKQIEEYDFDLIEKLQKIGGDKL